MAADPVKRAGGVEVFESLIQGGVAELFPGFAAGRPDTPPPTPAVAFVDVFAKAKDPAKSLKDVEKPAQVADNRPPASMRGTKIFVGRR